MEQKKSKATKRITWSVYVFVEREVIPGRSMSRKRRLTAKQEYRQVSHMKEMALIKFLYVNMTKMYKKLGILYIHVGIGKKEEMHMHDMKHVVSIQVRENDRSGRVQ